MQDETERLIAPLQEMRLGDSEREHIRERLISFMRLHPVSPYAGASFWERMRTRQSRLILPPHFVSLAAACLVLVISIGGGTTYASLLSLPGDPLYSLKVDVIEPLSGVFATTPQAKAELNVQLADRRLVEAEDLAAQGKLTPNTSAIVTTQLQSVTQAFDDSVQTLQDDHQTAAALDAQSTMEAALQAHQQVLASVAPPTDQNAISPIISLVEKHASSTNAARIRIQRSLPDSPAVATEQQQVAEAAADSIRMLADDSQQSVDGDAAQKIIAKSDEAQQQVDQGNNNLAEGNYTAAMSSFQSAIRTAKDTNVRVDALRRYRWRWRASSFIATSSSPEQTAVATTTATSTDDGTLASTTDATSTPQSETEASSTASSDDPDSLFDNDDSQNSQ